MSLDFFGEGLPLVASAQASLNMAEADAVVVRQEGSGHHGGGIPLGQDPSGAQLFQYGVEMGEDGSSDLGQGLIGAHQVEVNIGNDAEQVEHLVEHLAVLGGDADERFDARRAGELLHHGGHFHGLGAGAKNGEDAKRGHRGIGRWARIQGLAARFRPFSRQISQCDLPGAFPAGWDGRLFEFLRGVGW